MATVTVRLHGAFSDFAGGKRTVALEAATVGDALDALPGAVPGLRERIRDEHGRIREHLNVFHNEEEIRRLQGERTPLADGDVVHLMPAVSGGGKPMSPRKTTAKKPAPRKAARATDWKRQVAILVGTKKGGYIFRSKNGRSGWDVEGPLFAGGPVYHMAYDPRDGKSMWAAINSTWGGPRIERSTDIGKTWKTVRNPIFREDMGMLLKRTWHIEPGHPSDPDVVWAGTEPAGLFRTRDGGEYWETIDGLNRHPTRDRWEPGGGGLGLHSIAIDRGDAKHVGIGISAGGAYETRDGGVTWRPWNEAVRAGFLSKKEPTVGQCVHKLLATAEPGHFFQRNHEGIYWRGPKDDQWVETTEGLPTDYGFAGAVHPRDARSAYVIPLDPRLRMSMPETTGGGLAVYRTTDRGQTWKRLDRGLPKAMNAEVMREGMSTDALDPAGVYFGTQAGELWASRDEGEGWERLAQYLPPVLSVMVATI